MEGREEYDYPCVAGWKSACENTIWRGHPVPLPNQQKIQDKKGRRKHACPAEIGQGALVTTESNLHISLRCPFAKKQPLALKEMKPQGLRQLMPMRTPPSQEDVPNAAAGVPLNVLGCGKLGVGVIVFREIRLAFCKTSCLPLILCRLRGAAMAWGCK